MLQRTDLVISVIAAAVFGCVSCSIFHSQPASVQTVEKYIAVAVIDGACKAIDVEVTDPVAQIAVNAACGRIEQAIRTAKLAKLSDSGHD